MTGITSPAPETDLTRSLALLTPPECEAVAAALHDLSPHWTRRDTELPFFTLGAASYLDATNGRADEYRRKAQLKNPILIATFDWLHQRLAESLSKALGERCFYDPTGALARPGFHIFQSHEAFTRPIASIHFDQQYENVDFSHFPNATFDAHLSVTLAIRLPKSGAGLTFWPIHYRDLAALPKEQRRVRLTGLTPTEHPYQEGWAVAHSGHQLHQITPARSMERGDERITLQAHGVRVGDGIVLYW